MCNFEMPDTEGSFIGERVAEIAAALVNHLTSMNELRPVPVPVFEPLHSYTNILLISTIPGCCRVSSDFHRGVDYELNLGVSGPRFCRAVSVH